MKRMKWVYGLVVAAGLYVVARTVRRPAQFSPRPSREQRKAARKAAAVRPRRPVTPAA